MYGFELLWNFVLKDFVTSLLPKEIAVTKKLEIVS